MPREQIKEKVYDWLLLQKTFCTAGWIARELGLKVSSVKRALSQLKKDNCVAYINSGYKEMQAEKYNLKKYWGVK